MSTFWDDGKLVARWAGLRMHAEAWWLVVVPVPVPVPVVDLLRSRRQVALCGGLALADDRLHELRRSPLTCRCST